MNYTGIVPSVPFRSKGEKLFFSFGAASVITDQLINLSDMEGMMQFSLLAFLFHMDRVATHKHCDCCWAKLVLRTCFKLISVPTIKLP